jgi:hypothetical protein
MGHSFVSGRALGAASLWFLDPRRGGQRRAIVRDKMKHVAHELEQAARVGGHDLVHRAEGVRAELESMRRPTPSDAKLAERVRSELGRVCSHTRAIRVQADGHRVRLEGPVLASEADEIVRHVARLRGVEEIENLLDAHPDAAAVPSLQGEHVHRRHRRMSPAAHLVLGSGAGLLGVAALARGSVLGFTLGSIAAIANAHAIATRNRPLGKPRSMPQREREQRPQPRLDVLQGAAPPGVR